MDRTIVIAVSAPIPQAHRVEVVERLDDTGSAAVIAVTDLETRIRYQQSTRLGSEAVTWTGRVLECTVAATRGGVSTTLLIDPIGANSAEAEIALRGADAAAAAATGEALRWGGGDRVPDPEPPRFW